MMTSLDKLIYGRRSIRKYKEEPPPEDWINKMILAAMKAPSPSNSRPVRYVRLRSPEGKTRLHESMRSGRERLLRAIEETGNSGRLKNLVNAYYRYSEFMFNAPVLFAVGTSLKVLSLAERLSSAGMIEPTHNRHRDLDIAVGLALKGYLLKGEEFGLGSCILTAPLIFMEKPEEILSLEKIEIKCFITTGYPDETPTDFQKKNIADIYREI